MSFKLTTPFGTTEFPVGTMKTDPLAATASPHEFELWRRTMVVRVAGMAWIAPIFTFYKDIDVRKQLERQYLRALELDEDPLERYDEGRPLTREDAERLPTQLRPAAMDDLESISSVRSTIVGRAAEYEDDHLVARHRVVEDEQEHAQAAEQEREDQDGEYQEGEHQEERSGIPDYASQTPPPSVASRRAPGPASDHASAPSSVKLSARQRAQQ